MDLGLLIARLVVGLAMAAHGAQKLFGWFGGYGLAGTAGFMTSIGFPNGRLFALAAGLGELVAGLLVAAGLLGPVGPALILPVMIVAAVTVHRGQGYFASTNGPETVVLYAVAALVLALTGPGALSLDALLGLGWLSTPASAWAAVGLGIVGGVANLAIRRSPVARAAEAA